MEASLIFRAAAGLLTLAFVSGLAMAAIRFASDLASPPWLAKLHGFAAIGALALLGLAWASLALPPTGLYGLLILAAAAASGVMLNLGYHWKNKPLPEGLVFVHMSIAFIGFVIVGLMTLTLSS